MFALQLRKVVWNLFVPDCEDDDGNRIRDKVEIYFSSLNPTDSDSMKTLEIVNNRKTEVYSVELLADGGVKVSLSKVSKRSKLVVKSFAKGRHMNVLITASYMLHDS